MKQAELFLPVAIGDYTRLLHRHPPRHQHRQAAAPGQPAAAELQVGADRLSRARLVDRRLRHAACVRPHGQIKRPKRMQPASSARAGASITKSSSASSSARATRSANRSRSTRRSTTCSAWCCSTTGRRATSRPGNTSRSGPFLAKSFATTISPWIVTLRGARALPLSRRSRAPPAIRSRCPTCRTRKTSAKAVSRSRWRCTCARAKMKQRRVRLSRGNFRDSYWTPAQLVAHHTSNGCNLRPATCSARARSRARRPDSLGSLMELTQAGKTPLALPGGETRTFLRGRRRGDPARALRARRRCVDRLRRGRREDPPGPVAVIVC